MSQRFSRGFWRDVGIPVLRGCTLLALLTAAAYRLQLSFAETGFLYLVTIVLNCLNGAMAAAIALSVIGAVSLDYFFTEPRFSLVMANSANVAALIAFLTISLVTNRLAAKAREQSAEAKREHRNLQHLYDLSQGLLALDPLRSDCGSILDVLVGQLPLRAACIFDAETAEVSCAGDAGLLAARTRDAYIMGKDSNDAEGGLALRCFRAGGKTVGAIGIEGLENAEGMADPLAALVKAAIERGKSARAAADAAAEARTETLRSAILDALAHEFKTPLATILTAAGGLREAGQLELHEAELAKIVEDEAERLSNLSSRLLRLARLDTQEIRPRMETIGMDGLLEGIVRRYARQFPDHQITLDAAKDLPEIEADGELLQLALSQLLDNACRYSPPGSHVKVEVEREGDAIAMVVRNKGAAIEAGERRLIFQRFYRGPEGRRLASGTGLGLYVARKIALAHGGTLELDSSVQDDEVAFRLSIPLAAEETPHGV